MTDQTQPEEVASTLRQESPLGDDREARRHQVHLLLAGLVVAALVALFWPQGSGRNGAPGGFLVDAGGRPTPLASRLAPVTLVHFWATWCPPCIDEIPALQRLSQDFMDLPGFGITLVAVQDNKEQVERFLGPEAGLVLYDHNWEVAQRFGTEKLPETYLMAGGQVLEKFVGATDWDDLEIRERLLGAVQGAGS